MLKGYPHDLIRARSKDTGPGEQSKEPYKLEQEVLLGDFPTVASIDSQARGGNWISTSLLALSKLKASPCQVMEFESPLFTNMSVLSNEGVTVSITFKDWDLRISNTLFRTLMHLYCIRHNLK